MNSQDLIEKYIAGNLTPEEHQEFSLLCKNDASFKKELDFHINLQKVTAYEDNLTFKETVKSFETAHYSSKRNKRVWWVAASFIGVLIATYFFSVQQSSHETLFAENFEPYRNVIQPIVRGIVSDDLKTQAFTSYEKKEYKKAIQLFSEIQKTEMDSYYTFYKANSFLALDNTNKAISSFIEYIDSEGEFKDKATWYLALAYLKDKQDEKAITIFQKISDSKSYNHEKALPLLKKLK